jgi:hypothetical protein
MRARLLNPLVLALALAACERAELPAPVVTELTPQPAPPALPRLTRTQYLHSVADVFGANLALPSSLEPDAVFDDLASVGASVAKVSPRGVELYEDAARSLAAQVAGKPERLAALLPCQPTSAVDGACLDQMVGTTGRMLWRRSLTSAERQRVTALGVQASLALGSFAQGAEYALVALLQSPNFLYRRELAQPGGRLTGVDLAAKLAFFLWTGPPDKALLDAAEAGELDTDTGLAKQVDRMLTDARLRRAVRNFTDEWLQLRRLPELSKDPKVFKHFSADLGDSAREETLRLVEHLTVDLDADMRQLLTTRTTFVDRRLAAIYDIPALTDEGHAEVKLPADGERQGLLGQVSFLAWNAHAISTSPTLRGVYVRRYLLCDVVPPPPADLNTALPEPSATAKTMRERLMVHMSVPNCKGCHQQFDLLGLTFERFDGIGRFRATDNGTPVDTSGGLDGATYTDAGSFAAVLAQNPKYSRCIAKKLYAYAAGRPVVDGERAQVTALAQGFDAQGRKLKGLMRDIALSPGFRQVGPVVGGGAP